MVSNHAESTLHLLLECSEDFLATVDDLMAEADRSLVSLNIYGGTQEEIKQRVYFVYEKPLKDVKNDQKFQAFNK